MGKVNFFQVSANFSKLPVTKNRSKLIGRPWTPEEHAKLLSMRRQNKGFEDIALALNRTKRSVEQMHLKLVPVNPSPSRSKAAAAGGPMSEEKKIKLLAVVAKRKPLFWKEVANEVGGVSGAQCEAEWAEVIRRRN